MCMVMNDVGLVISILVFLWFFERMDVLVFWVVLFLFNIMLLEV